MDFLNLSTPTPTHNQPIHYHTLKVALFIMYSQHNHINSHHQALPTQDSTELVQLGMVHKQVSGGPVRVCHERHRCGSTQHLVDAVHVVELPDYAVVFRG